MRDPRARDCSRPCRTSAGRAPPSLGVAPSGALDRGAARTANRLVGNPEGAAGIEVTMGGLRVVAQRDLWFAVTGAWGPIRLGAAHEVDPYEAHAWPAGAELHLDWFGHGARAYLAVRGGLEAPAVLGSRVDRPAGGHRPRAAARRRSTLPVGDEPHDPIPVAVAGARGAHRTTTSSRSSSPRARGPTGSRHPPIERSSSRSGP